MTFSVKSHVTSVTFVINAIRQIEGEIMDMYDTQKDQGSRKVKPKTPDYVPEPIWLPFPGFSYIFDNPGSSLEPEGHIQRLNIADLDVPELALYKAIFTAVKQIDPDDVAKKYNFFTLPPQTYHVTVWDGLNLGNLDDVKPVVRSQFNAYFENAITSAMKTWPPLAEIIEFENYFSDMGTVELEFSKLISRGRTVLVADLSPADEVSMQRLTEIQQLREKLDEEFEHRCEKHRNTQLRPHVAIGYFSDEALASKAVFQNMDRWMQVFRKAALGKTIKFSSVGLYAFTDMLTYFKRL
jgi:hypothetical protein